MNKKQLIVAWVAVGLISSICLGYFSTIVHRNSSVDAADEVWEALGAPSPSAEEIANTRLAQAKKQLVQAILLIIPLFLAGGLLIYTLKERKK